MSEAPHAPEGQVIEGRYRVVSRIADGGMATVYQAVDERLERTVAIKIMHTQLAQGPHRDQFVERFHREARSAAAIANPHIVQVYDTGEFDGLDYLVMEYVHGVNLRYEMNQQGTFSVRETLRIIGETLDGLASAHRAGVVHRDIKPENINLPSGTVKDDEIAAHCAAYEQKIKDCGGIDLQILGIGRTGHIGFNEPGSDDTTVTRQVHLDELTRSDAAPAFGGIENVPTTAITMGVATIMGAREVALMAWGEKKASIVKKAVQGPVTVDVAASYLQKHPNAKFLLDKGAASLL